MPSDDIDFAPGLVTRNPMHQETPLARPSPKLPAGNFGFRIFRPHGLRGCWKRIARHGLEGNKNPKKLPAGNFSTTMSNPALPGAPSSPGQLSFAGWLCLLCAQRFPRPLIRKCTHFLDKEPRPPNCGMRGGYAPPDKGTSHTEPFPVDSCPRGDISGFYTPTIAELCSL